MPRSPWLLAAPRADRHRGRWVVVGSGRASFLMSPRPAGAGWRAMTPHLHSTWAQEAPGLLRLLPRREPLRPVDARELARLRVPGDEARDEKAGAEVEVGAAPGGLTDGLAAIIARWISPANEDRPIHRRR
jgi:hypothetical protein